jgi:hypothetical protein
MPESTVMPPGTATAVPPGAPVQSQNIQPQQFPSPNIPPSATLKEGKPFYRLWSFWVTLFLIINASIFGGIWIYPYISPAVMVQDQVLGAVFQIQKVRVPEAGLLGIQVDVGGVPGTLLASSRLLIPDTYENFSLHLLGPEDLPPEALALIRPGTRIYVTLFKDLDNNENFNPSIDTEIVRDIFGRKVQSTFILKSTP